jgi:nitroimidazol reductase NimA-like FMN-containing flavoprotein (pyridoxamine 5'-phosphate oxidase superfamily)
MTDKKEAVFDPTKLETLNVATDYPMEQDEFEKLFKYNAYCEMGHVNKKGYPIVTPMFYVVIDGFIYISSIKKHRAKVMDLEENPKMSVTIHNDGCNLKRQKAILVIGNAEVIYEDELMRKVHWAILDKYWSEVVSEEQRQAAFAAVHTPMRAIIKVVPNKVMSWDFGKMVQAYEKGVWFNEAYLCSKQYDK